MMIYMLRSRFTGGHLSAVILLMCGAAVLQFSTPSDISNSFTGSLLLFLQTIVLAGASVYNQKIYQRSNGSFHAMNITLFGYSAALNGVLTLSSVIRSESPLMATGTSVGSIIIAVISNVLIGIASAFVLKHNDALVMYFVLSLSTAFLLCFEQFFTASISLLAIPGAGVILLATYQYFLGTSPSGSEPSSPLEPAKIQLAPHPTSKVSRYLKTPVGLIIATVIAILITIPLDIYQNSIAHNISSMRGRPIENWDLVQDMPDPSNIVTSPFKNTVAFIRINHDLPQREKLVRDAYEPFFHTVHVSMPSDERKHGKHKVTETSPERDYWDDSYLPYPPVKDLLNLLLEKEQAEEHSTKNSTSSKGPIEGLLYFHFDAWIDPLGFQDMPFDKLWYPTKGDVLSYKCMRGDPYRAPNWMWFVNNDGLANVKKSNRVAASLLPHMNIDVEEYCLGWSDIYYVPQRFFQDYIDLTGAYGAVPLFHEIALPTIWRIIERTYSTHPSNTVLYRWGDCFGGCCHPVEFKDEILENRCGHKFDYLQWETTRVHYDRMEKNKKLLGKPWPTDNKIMAWENWV
jgi:hypothetical protein